MEDNDWKDAIRGQMKRERERQLKRDRWEQKKKDIIHDYKAGFKGEEVSINRLRYLGFGASRAKELLHK